MLFFISKRQVRLLCCICLCAALFAIATARATAPPALFPEYPCIQKNILFWEGIYGKYGTDQGVLHDSDDLGRIYAVLSLVDQTAPNAATINNERIAQGKARISDILQQLAAGKPPATAEARRIAALFPRKHSSIYLAACDTLRFQLGQKDRFREGVIRSGKYLPAFRKILAKHHLPPDLVYLPHVESSYNPKAYSKAGAAGLWQLTRATGSDYLNINASIDERLDPYTATDAAARLLKDNFEALQSWPLALTAYNYGRAGMMRAVQSKGSYEAVFNSYDQGYFKFAARNFYAEFLAARRVAKSLERNPGIALERPENLDSLRLQKAMTLKQVSLQTGLSSEILRRHNPALQKPVFEGVNSIPSGYVLRIPAKRPSGKPSPQPLAANKARSSIKNGR